jgi:two-component system response regulator NreC
VIRVLLAEDMAIVRAGLRLLLEEAGLTVSGEAGSGREALERVAQDRPDLVLMDITMPDMDGLEATRRLRAAHPNLPILVLTIHEDTQLFFRLLEAGANGYLVKGAAPGDLVAAVRTVAGGGAYLYPSLARHLREEKPAPLTEREREVLHLTAEGLTARQVGRRLGISPHTVSRHRANIMEKLGLRNRTELIRYALERRLIGPGPA